MHSPQAFVAPNASVSSPGPLAPSSALSPQIVIPKSSLANPHSRAAYPEQYLQQGHPYRRAPTHNSPAPSSTPTPTSTSTYQGHIASTIASSAVVAQQQSTSPPPFFSARTSSLLPPPHLTAKRSSPTTPTAHIPPALQSNPNANYPYADLPPLSETDPSASTRRPSRSSSVSGVAGDSIRNLNRWSASTTSSHASNPAFQRNIPAGGRRMSVDAVALQARSTTAPPPPSYAAPTYNSPRKLQKSRRPSTASGDSPRAPASATTARPYSPAPIGPLESLPPIVALPSLEQEVRAGTPSLADRSLANRPPLLRQASANASDLSGHATSTSRGSESATVEEPASPRSRMQMRAVAGNAMAIDRNGDGKGHARHRSQGGKGSSDSAKNRERSKPSQKAMLSRALEKANTAVQLDNAGNVEGARAAYSEACDLLHQVLLRTSGDDDRKKLEEIRKTYTTRIDELDQLEAPTRRDGRPLPTRPESRTRGPNRTSEDSQEWPSGLRGEIEAALDEDDIDPRATASSYAIKTSTGYRMRQDSSVSMKNGLDVPRTGAATPQMRDQYSLQSSFSRSPGGSERMARLDVEHPMQNQYMPPPLSPRRPPSPRRTVQPSPEHFRADYSMTSERRPSVSGSDKGHAKANSQESISWLDPIDESGGSDVSSVHSRSASMGVRRKHIRAASGDTEAEFDAALDDAIEAAYDDGYEPMDPNEVNKYGDDDEDVVARALKKVQLARERVKESEREALALANEQEKRLRQQLEEEDDEGGNFYDGNESEEEERMLEEMTTGYAIEEFAFGLGQKKPGFPRESDSSELTSRTWHSSTGSNPPTATTILSTVSENTVVPDAAKSAVPSIPPPPPPASSLPKLPPQAKGAKSAANADTVRDRRLSGQNPKQLKIETSKIGPPPGSLTGPVSAAQPKAGGFIVQQRQALSAGPNRVPPPFSRHGPSPVPGDMAPPPTPPLPQGEYDPRSGSPSLSRQGLRKNFSSSSLKSMKTRNMSLSNLDDASDMSPGTPHSNQFGAASRLPAMPNLPTPVATAFKDRMMTNGGTGGLHLFDSDFHSPASPGSPNPLYADAPVPLESCPTDSMLRPFWLMRCLFQTLVHPRGGYISNKLFVPQDVWKVRNVKLKNVEDKVANCDLLTAALMNLAKVDTCDADAVLEEMQSLENVLEQVQLALTRKLGNEVGVNHTSTMFKDASSGLDAETGTNSGSAAARSGSVSGKTSSGFSWRRLRSKNSSSGLNSGYSGGGALARKDSIPENSAAMAREAVLPSLPMTSHPTSRPSKRDLAGVQFTGPQAHYMASLARLFDAAQAVDQIARQVEDPGLRHADKTQVGLELCTRHAAEFFGFYICRFVLADLTMLLDKFMKRGSEWVLV